jgi:AcrR family transcriptional regulator
VETAEERRARRRLAILDAALALLIERGYAGTSMRAVAERARASKETLYAWFGDKPGLFAALVTEQAESTNRRLRRALAEGEAQAGSPGSPPAAVLEAFGADLLALLLGPTSVAINRAAAGEATTAPELGRLLVARGRQATGALVVRYLELQRAAGRLSFPDAGAAFGVLLGLLTRDWQIRVLVGELLPPSEDERRARAVEAVSLFLTLYGTDPAGAADGAARS